MLHVVQISFLLDPQKRRPEQILQDWWPLVVGAEAIARSGVRVTVVQACIQTAHIRQNGVDYHFVSPEPGASTVSTAQEFVRLISVLKADVFHVHGLGFSGDVLTLSGVAPGTPIFLQDHADRVPRFWRRRARRLGMSVAAGISFCALEQAKPFLDARLIHPRTRIFEIPECSSRFIPGDRETARQMTGIHGNPAALWVGHLDSNKDPLTVLRGIAEAVRRLPDLHLWYCFASTTLLSDVRAHLERHPGLAERVHLLGKRPHHEVEHLMRAADLFVLGSHREGSGVSVIESLACGLPPIVTDIPSFRSLTDGGRVGALWPCGDGRKLSEALISAAARPRTQQRAAARARFDAHLSFEAVGRSFAAAYGGLLGTP